MVNPGTQDPSPTKDVFLSFRGEDTRAGFTTTLYNILMYKDVKTFMDAENLPVGEEISDYLLDAIDNAKVAIIVFSENYASSSWCLDELVKIIQCKDRRRMKVIPVFYKIEPSIVRHQTGPYKTAMDVHKEKYELERIKKWRSALISASNVSGLGTNDFKYEFDLITKIVDVASKALVGWNEDFNMTRQANWLARLVCDYFLSEQNVSESVESAAVFDWGDVAAAAAKEANARKDVKDKENESLTAAVASPKLEIGKAGHSCRGGEDHDELVFFGDSSEDSNLKKTLKDILDSLHDESFRMAGIYRQDDEKGLEIRRLQGVKLSKKNFQRKINAVAELQHENLVRLRAYYLRTDDILLFYDYRRIWRSLYEALHDHRNSGRRWMVWEIRLGIALGAARGIESIHSQGVNMSHGNIKSSNIHILVGESNETRVSDYCLADLVNPSSTLCATFDGYRAPEVSDPRQVPQQADVYSFGVVLIELVSGKDPTRPLLKWEKAGLPKWVTIWEEAWIDRIDHELLGDSDSEMKMLQLLRLGVACTASRPSKRPKMREVIRRIEKIKERSDVSDSKR